MIHLCGFGQSVDPAAVYVNIDALLDPVLTTSGDNLQCPTLNQAILIAAGVSLGGNQLARLSSPSIRDEGRYQINPQNGGGDGDAEPSTPPSFVDLRGNPLPFRVNENITAEVHSNPTNPAFQWVLLWLSDGAVTPVRGGDIRTYRFTNTSTLAVDVWTNGALTADEQLAVGKYQVVGMRYLGTGAIAARLVFRGGTGWRPGCIGADDSNDLDGRPFRQGEMGVWGEFPSNQIPSVDFLAVSADTDQEVFLDLIKISDTL